jgi:hypothetical protein
MDEILMIIGVSYIAYTSSNTYVPKIKREIVCEGLPIGTSAEELYFYSLRIHGRLPNHLHEMMILWSFDPTKSDYVKDYFSWIETCEKREQSRNIFETKMKRIDSINKILLIAVGSCIILVLLI